MEARKETVGFKCSPDLRIYLTDQAERLGVSLSSHIETLLLGQKSREEKIQELSKANEELGQRIQFYETNPFLTELFNKYKGQKVTFTTPDGKGWSLQIEAVRDVFTVIVSSFKIDKQ